MNEANGDSKTLDYSQYLTQSRQPTITDQKCEDSFQQERLAVLRQILAAVTSVADVFERNENTKNK